MSNRCETCDRAECPLFTGDFDVRSEVDGRMMWNVDFARRAPAERDCDAHRVDWRTRCKAMEPVVAAADALTPTSRFRLDTYPKSALVRLYEAVEEYRAKETT